VITYRDTSQRAVFVGLMLVFCEEINLPANDKSTQRVITFLRQLTEQGGFWRTGHAVDNS